MGLADGVFLLSARTLGDPDIAVCKITSALGNEYGLIYWSAFLQQWQGLVTLTIPSYAPHFPYGYDVEPD